MDRKVNPRRSRKFYDGPNYIEGLTIECATWTLTVASLFAFEKARWCFRDFRLQNGVLGKNDPQST